MKNPELHTQFETAAYNLRNSSEQRMDICTEIIDHPDFKTYASDDPSSAYYTLRTAFDVLNQEDSWQAIMAFIQTDGAIAMANGSRPEDLANLIKDVRKKLSVIDGEFVDAFFWQTRAGQALKTNYPAAPLFDQLMKFRNTRHII